MNILDKPSKMKRKTPPRKAKSQADGSEKPSEKEQREKLIESTPLCSIPNDYPLELLGNIAARLLVDDSYEKAVTRAFALLEECSSQLAVNRMMRETKMNQGFREAERNFNEVRSMSPGEIRNLTPQQKLEYRLPLNFNEMAKLATGEVRPDRAKEKILNALAAANGGWTPEQRAEKLRQMEKWQREKRAFIQMDIDEYRLLLGKNTLGTKRERIK